MAHVADLFISHQVNLVLICFEPSTRETIIAESFVERINQLSEDKIIPVEAFLLIDPTPSEVEELMVKRVANVVLPKNQPLITETFT